MFNTVLLEKFGKSLVELPSDKSQKGKLPFSLEELKEVTGEPERTDAGSWYFSVKGKLFPYMVIINPSEKAISFKLENDQAHNIAMATIFSSRLFTDKEGREILKFAEEAKTQLLANSMSEGERICGRFKARFFRNNKGLWVMKIESKD